MAEFGSNQKVVLTDEQIEELEHLGSTLSVDQCADYFGVAKQTFYNILERQPEAGRRYRLGKAKMVVDMGQSIIKQGREGNIQALMFYLKTQAGWRETNVTEHTGDVTLRTITRTIVDPKA